MVELKAGHKVAMGIVAAGGGWATGMYCGNWPHRAIHHAIEGRPDPGTAPDDHDPSHYHQDSSDGDTAAIGGAIQLATTLGITGGSLALGARTGRPLAGRIGAVAGAGAFVGVTWELLAGTHRGRRRGSRPPRRLSPRP